MNEQKIIEAMARADGFTYEIAVDFAMNNRWFKGGQVINNLPDYLTDDNEVDRMVRGLFDKGPEYIKALYELLSRKEFDSASFDHIDAFYCAKATTAQKVEAYLRVKGMWTKEME